MYFPFSSVCFLLVLCDFSCQWVCMYMYLIWFGDVNLYFSLWLFRYSFYAIAIFMYVFCMSSLFSPDVCYGAFCIQDVCLISFKEVCSASPCMGDLRSCTCFPIFSIYLSRLFISCCICPRSFLSWMYFLFLLWWRVRILFDPIFVLYYFYV